MRTRFPNRMALLGIAATALLAATNAHASAKDGSASAHSPLTIAIGGDLLGPYHSIAAIEDSGFEEVKAILSGSDVVVANHEQSTFDAEDHAFYPSAENNGLPLSPEIVARELRAMGVRLLSKANNHAVDWGLEGLAATEAALELSGIAYAGSGSSEDAARAVAIVETPKGAVGLASMASTFQAMAQAGNAAESRRGPLRARPGISVVRTEALMRLAADDIASLARIPGAKPGEAGERVTLGTQAYVAGVEPGWDYAMDERDETAILKGLREGIPRTRATIAAIHAHETDDGDSEDPTPPDFVVELAHAAIDEGAMAFVRHGPHGVNGVEIYKGRPVFYGVGSMYFDFGGRRSYTVPATGQVIRFPDTWFEGFIARLVIGKAGPEAVELYPVLFDDTPGDISGIPRLAHGTDAQRILARVQRYSDQFGTRIATGGDVGRITLGQGR